MKIKNIEELARSVDTTVSDLKEHIRTYTDYPTEITWDNHSVTIQTSVPEIDEQNEKVLSFPFADEDFDDAISGLQCWADAVWCEERHKEE